MPSIPENIFSLGLLLHRQCGLIWTQFYVASAPPLRSMFPTCFPSPDTTRNCAFLDPIFALPWHRFFFPPLLACLRFCFMSVWQRGNVLKWCTGNTPFLSTRKNECFVHSAHWRAFVELSRVLAVRRIKMPREDQITHRRMRPRLGRTFYKKIGERRKWRWVNSEL